jgi:hypothetical protein
MMKISMKVALSAAVAAALSWSIYAFAASKVSGVSGKSSGTSSTTSKSGGMATNPKLRTFTSRGEIKANKTVPVGSGGGAPTSSSTGGPGAGLTQSNAATSLGFGRPLKAKRPSKLKALPPH